MPTPKQGYWITVDGKRIRVPSVSTVLNTLGWGSDNLMRWARDLALTGINYETQRDKAANIGTIAHQMIDDHLHKKEFDPTWYDEELVKLARPAYHAYLGWERQHRLEVLRTEAPLVSHEHRYGGTPDALVRLDRSEVVLLDFKTSNWLFAKHVIQVVAYMDLIEENHGTQLRRGVVLRVGKDGQFRVVEIEGEHIVQARQAFRALLQVHQVKYPLEKLVEIPKSDKPVTSEVLITLGEVA